MSVSRLFSAYVIVAFSAAEGRKTGESSVWIGVLKHDVRFRPIYEAHNPATRAEAMSLLRTLLRDLHKRGDKVLLGFDFAFGLPRGTAAALKLKGVTEWEATWDFLGRNIVDKADNTNNRFAVAAKMNRLMTDAAFPFWGCPKSAAQKWLASVKPDSHGTFPEFRLCEMALNNRRKGSVRSLWQMHGAAISGGRAMLGITALKALKSDLGDVAVLWPFETGFAAPDPESAVTTLIAEISLQGSEAQPVYGEFKDAALVRVAAHDLAQSDSEGNLLESLCGPKSLSEEELKIAREEEGWILGAA